jgi:hypothetical protein
MFETVENESALESAADGPCFSLNSARARDLCRCKFESIALALTAFDPRDLATSKYVCMHSIVLGNVVATNRKVMGERFICVVFIFFVCEIC